MAATPRLRRKPTIQVRQDTRTLKVTLTDQERKARGIELAELRGEYNSKEMALKAYQKEKKEELDMLDTKIDGVASIVRCGYEVRPVAIEERWDWELGRITEVRLDTNEVVKDREMTTQEKQISFLDPVAAGQHPDAQPSAGSC